VLLTGANALLGWAALVARACRGCAGRTRATIFLRAGE